VEYHAKGRLINNSSKIIKDGKLVLRFVLVLKNGNAITDADANETGYMLAKSFEILNGEFIPMKQQEFDLRSAALTEEFKFYPIDKFYIKIMLEGNNALNNDESISEVILQKDVTKEWNEFMKSFTGTHVPESKSASAVESASDDANPEFSNHIGTTIYCDSPWIFQVTISAANRISIKVFSDEIPSKIKFYKGKIVNGIIYSNDPDDANNLRGKIYKIDDDKFYQLNVEGEYNEYKICN
jgi:hypothetical protein